MNVEFIPNKETEKYMLGLPDKVMYTVARITLDLTMPTIPMSRGKSTSGQLRRSTSVYGVRGSDGDYTIGSATSYAKYVYDMPSTTHWTTTGTNERWFHKTFEKKHNSIVKQAIDRTWKGK